MEILVMTIGGLCICGLIFCLANLHTNRDAASQCAADDEIRALRAALREKKKKDENEARSIW